MSISLRQYGVIVIALFSVIINSGLFAQSVWIENSYKDFVDGSFTDENITTIDLGRNDQLMYIKGADFNNDGWLDLFLTSYGCEPEGNRPSLLYFGSADGFKQVAINSYDRGLYEDYFSSIYSIKENEWPAKIEWEAEKPFGTDVHFQIRVADTKKEIESVDWMGPDGKDSWFTNSGSSLENYKGKFIQYSARLSTPNGAATPYLTSVTITFEKN